MTQLDEKPAAPATPLVRRVTWGTYFRRFRRSDSRAPRLVGSIALSMSVSALVVVSSWQSDSRLGAPLYWTWVLTGLQVVALWAAGRRRSWAWLLGAGVQPVWIVYAVLTGQLGFVPGCVLSMTVQLQNFFTEREADPGHATDGAAGVVVASPAFLRSSRALLGDGGEDGRAALQEHRVGLGA